MNFDQIARYLIFIGAFIGVIGLVLLFAVKYLGFGRIPGDLVVQHGDWRFMLPIVSSIVLSIILTILVNVLLWIFRR